MEIVQIAVLGFVLVSFVKALREGSTVKKSYRILRGLRPWHYVPGFLTLVGVLSLGALLYQVPGLHWGWWQMLGGEGNPALGQTTSTTLATGIVGTLVFVCFLAVLPVLAYKEEEIFRSGAESRGVLGNLAVATLFGLIHVVGGVPIAFGIALIFGGLTLNWVYLRAHRKAMRPERQAQEGLVRPDGTPYSDFEYSLKVATPEAVAESTRVHIAWNSIVAAGAVVVIVTTSFV